jgi:hypothetical protein
LAAKRHPSRGCRAGRREREQRAVRYAACATGWIPDFHSTRRQPATAAGVRGRGRAQVHGVNVNNIIRPTNVHTENRYAANLSAAAADEISSLKP